MRYLSLCSGIEAATVAWHGLGWTPVAFAEIEPFPSAVLAHHYPQVPNLGDMTRFREWPEEVFLEADLIVAGTPCQAFSVAGLRGSLTDARGNLTLILIQLLNHAAQIRHHAGRPAPLLLWENVPGVLNTPDNAFGCFLGGLAGEDDPLTPPGPGWTDAGYVCGPQRAIAWRLLDAQYFGLAQRRERVFLVASPADGTGPHPAEVLFESAGLRRDTPPRRQTGQNPAPTLSARTQGGGGLGTDFDLDGGLDESSVEIARPLRAQAQSIHQADKETYIPEVAHALRAEGFDASEDGTGRGTPLIPVAFGGNNLSGPIEVATAVRAHPTPHLDFESETFLVGTALSRKAGCAASDSLPPVAFDTTQAHPPAIAFQERGREDGRSLEFQTDLAYSLNAPNGGGRRQELNVCAPIAFPERLSATQCASAEDLSPNLQARNPTAVAFSTRTRGDDGRGYDRPPQVFGDICGALETVKPHCVAFAQNQVGEIRTGDVLNTLNTNSNASGRNTPMVATFQQSSLRGKGTLGYDTTGLTKPCKTQPDGQMIHAGYQVRRLTPVECERLQGFRDNYTLIPWRNKPAELCPDGPRYKALGNSMAVPVMRWLGQRLNEGLTKHNSTPTHP